MRKIIKLAILSTVTISVAALATDAAPSGFQFDNSDGKGDIINGVHKTDAVAAGRAEWRCEPDNNDCSKRSGTINFSKQIKINGGANISVAQFLNIKGSGTTGSSEPISQLTVDDQSNNTYRVSIEQGNYNCNFRVPKSTWMNFEAGITKGGTGWFKINNQFCQRPANSSVNRFAGSPDDDQFTNGVNTYYFKYGAYNAAENSTPSSVSWR